MVGIDLGTTNSVLSFLDTQLPEEEQTIQLVSISQSVNPGEVASLTQLPSFAYVPGEGDFPPGSTALPWNEQPRLVVGELARKRGAENPMRLISSAKSWLSATTVNRTAPILPWKAPEEVEKLSPVEASAEYLRHLRIVWDVTVGEGNPEHALARQTVFLTVPASFDEEARELTLRAAHLAGLQQVVLLEEPQAAFYAWISAQGNRWRKQVKVGDLILVCDVGGGTTDFSLIVVTEANGELSLERVAVGEHILLGGDNMDLALARLLQLRLEQEGHKIDTWQLHSLWHQARLAKEKLFSQADSESQPVTLLGRGSRLIGGTITTELQREDLETVLVNGFFPKTEVTDMPARQRRIGLQEMGLPYAADAAVTKHLARFLVRQTGSDEEERLIRRGESGFAAPTHILFNGGVMKAGELRERLVEVLNSWLAVDGFEPVLVLDAPDLDHAVSHGAVYYGNARLGKGVRIRSGSPRTYYIGIESAMPAVPGLEAPLKALCVVPFGMEEGTSAKVGDREFGLIVGEPAEFRFLSSTVRKHDTIGSLIEDWGDDIQEVNPLEVTLDLEGMRDAVLPIRLETKITEVGTLELWCVTLDGKNRWKLECNIRESEE
ncbi:MAG: Hsp70 family protein [Blastocatellia bacterium]|nr:Hsp70 family protein [Blastocatellia bacterium]